MFCSVAEEEEEVVVEGIFQAYYISDRCAKLVPFSILSKQFGHNNVWVLAQRVYNFMKMSFHISLYVFYFTIKPAVPHSKVSAGFFLYENYGKGERVMISSSILWPYF